MKSNSAFPSDYLKSADISGMGEKFTMKSVTNEEFTDPETKEVQAKPVLWFENTPKGLILNKTNWNRISKLLAADDSDNWIGKEITLRLEAVEAFGKTTDAIRVAV